MMTYGNPTGSADNGVAGIDYRYRNSSLFGSQVFVADAYVMKSFSEGIDSNDLSYNHDWARGNGSYKRTEADLFARLVWTHRF